MQDYNAKHAQMKILPRYKVKTEGEAVSTHCKFFLALLVSCVLSAVFLLVIQIGLGICIVPLHSYCSSKPNYVSSSRECPSVGIIRDMGSH